LGLGLLGCEQRGGEQSKSDARAAGASQKSFQRKPSQMVKEEWRKKQGAGTQGRQSSGRRMDRGMIMAKLIADSTTPERKISVAVENHVVTLRGRVESVGNRSTISST
jgi:osmotically-inducible protein OsmY